MRYPLLGVVVALFLPIAGGSVASRVAASRFVSSTQPFQPTNDAERAWHDRFRQAYELDRARRIPEAIRVLEECLELAAAARCESCRLRTLANLAGDRLGAMQYREALDVFLEARALARRLGDREMAGVVSLNLSNLYLNRYALNEAWGAAEEAIGALSEATQPWLRTKVLIQKARLLARRGDMDAAKQVYGEIVREAGRTGDRAAEAFAWEQLGLDNMRLNDLAPAEQALVEAYRLRKLNNDASLGASYHSLSMLRLRQGDAESALRLAEQAIQRWHRWPSIRPMWQLRLARGRALAKLDRGQEALAELDEAIREIRLQRLEALPADALRISFGAGTNEVYAARIETGNELALSGAPAELVEQGFRLAEEARGLSLREATGEREQLRRNLPPEYFDALTGLQAAHVELLRKDTLDNRRSVEAMRRRLTEIEASAGLAAGEALGDRPGRCAAQFLPRGRAVVSLDRNPRGPGFGTAPGRQ
jgi:tetratricopeptide (TPR) repeat protein